MPVARLRLAALAAALLWAAGAAAPAPAPSPDEVRSRMRERLRGRHFTAQVRLEIERGSQREQRKLLVWRDDADGGSERFMARFERPPDMRGLGILYLERADRPNDYFLYQPALARVRRVPESMVRQDVYGVDLEYLGFGIAQLEPAEIVSLEADTLEGRPVYRLVEKATRPDSRFERRTLWLDPDRFVPLRAVHERDGRVLLEVRTLELREVDGVPTPVAARFERPLDREVVHLFVDEVDYRSPIPEAFFSTLKLIQVR
jgi:hypothetical protein